MSSRKPLAIGPLLVMVVLCGLCKRSDCGTNMRLGGAIRVLWRILDGKDRSGLFSCSKLRAGSPRSCRLRTGHLAPVSKFNYILVHTRFMGSHKLSSFDGLL
jgi:hypothetical protein